MEAEKHFSSNQERFIAQWKEFLRFQSISTDPSFHEQCLTCAEWLVQRFSHLGARAELWSTATKPVVFAEFAGNTSKPTVLFYGHYDVQPVDPLEFWTTPPFEPTLRDGRIYARGAQDNKGQVSYFIAALEALRAQQVDLPPIKVLLEGEEECGSKALHAGLEGWKGALKADVLMVCDTGMIAKGVPTITMGLRGIGGLEVRVHGPHSDLHSGVYGGMVRNPIQALTSLLASGYNSDGSVAIPGFYDGVKDIPEGDRKLAASAPLNVQDVEAALGVELAGGEERFSPLERRGFRPTLEINGIGGGYQGAGGKTVIPSHAFAKVTARLVAGQDPEKTIDAIGEFFCARAPRGVRVEVVDKSVGGPALQLSTSSPLIARVAECIQKIFNAHPVYMWEGASIPLVTKLPYVSGAEPVLVGFGLEEDQIHAPNESFSLEQFEQGYRYVTAFLASL